MIDFFKNRIMRGPTSAIYEKGVPVAWTGTYHHTPWISQLGYLFVEPSARRKGYGRALSIDIVNKIVERGRIPVIHVFKGNTASEKLVESLGFEPLEDRGWGSINIK